jgi:hypothetical protein
MVPSRLQRLFADAVHSPQNELVVAFLCLICIVVAAPVQVPPFLALVALTLLVVEVEARHSLVAVGQTLAPEVGCRQCFLPEAGSCLRSLD